MSLLALQHNFRDWLIGETEDATRRCGHRAEAGLAVYLNNYRAQLMACLSESYGTVRAWLGDAAFEAAAATHIALSPPRSWTLDAYAPEFAGTLDRLYPDDPEVGELACLERALGLAFIGPDAAPVDPAALESIDWDRAILRLVPTFTLLRVTTNAGAIWSALARGDQPPAAQPLAQQGGIIVWRNGFIPAFRMLEAPEIEALDVVKQGHSFAALCARLVERHGEELGPAQAGHFLGQWLADQLVMEVTS